MRPGDVVTCSCCGAQARATWSSRERPWQEGWPVTVTWTHGPHERHQVVTGEAPTTCSWCWERRQALGPDAQPLYLPGPSAPTGCYYLRDGRPTDGCRPTSACWTEACGAAGVARPAAPDVRAAALAAGFSRQDAESLAEQPELADEFGLPPAAPPEPRHRTYLDDRLDGTVPEPAPAPTPTQLGLF